MANRQRRGGRLKNAGVLRHDRQRRFEAEHGRHLTGFNFHARLDQRGHARSAHRMPDLTREGAKQQRLATRRAPVNRDDCAQLFLVALRQAGAVHFDQGDVGRFDLGGLKRPVHCQPQRFLDTLGVCPADAPDDRVDSVAVFSRFGQPLEQQYADALTGHNSAGRRVKRTAGMIAQGQDTVDGHGFVLGQVHASLAAGADHHVAIARKQHVNAGGKHGGGGRVTAVDGRRASHQVHRLGDARRQRAGAEAAAFVNQGGPMFQHDLAELRGDRRGAIRGNAVSPHRLPQEHFNVRQPQAEFQLC